MHQQNSKKSINDSLFSHFCLNLIRPAKSGKKILPVRTNIFLICKKYKVFREFFLESNKLILVIGYEKKDQAT